MGVDFGDGPGHGLIDARAVLGHVHWLVVCLCTQASPANHGERNRPYSPIFTLRLRNHGKQTVLCLKNYCADPPLCSLDALLLCCRAIAHRWLCCSFTGAAAQNEQHWLRACLPAFSRNPTIACGVHCSSTPPPLPRRPSLQSAMADKLTRCVQPVFPRRDELVLISPELPSCQATRWAVPYAEHPQHKNSMLMRIRDQTVQAQGEPSRTHFRLRNR